MTSSGVVTIVVVVLLIGTAVDVTTIRMTWAFVMLFCSGFAGWREPRFFRVNDVIQDLVTVSLALFD